DGRPHRRPVRPRAPRIAAARTGGVPVARPPALAQRLLGGARRRAPGGAPRHAAPARGRGDGVARAAALRAALPAHPPLGRVAGAPAGAVGGALAPHRLPRRHRRRAGRGAGGRRAVPVLPQPVRLVRPRGEPPAGRSVDRGVRRRPPRAL
ncbi:MAG: hypothetical protein AVDCRST_MAG08-989, partial [uncultured Acetobacteraceae bacterium]